MTDPNAVIASIQEATTAVVQTEQAKAETWIDREIAALEARIATLIAEAKAAIKAKL